MKLIKTSSVNLKGIINQKSDFRLAEVHKSEQSQSETPLMKIERRFFHHLPVHPFAKRPHQLCRFRMDRNDYNSPPVIVVKAASFASVLQSA